MTLKSGNGNIPHFFNKLISLGCLSPEQIKSSGDGFFAALKPLSDILTGAGIAVFPSPEDKLRSCELFYDDWFLYAVSEGENFVYGLFKMREQEHDAKLGYIADGDTPGVTVSFISFDVAVLEACLKQPEFEQRKALNIEIDRVVAAPGQRHDRVLKRYFVAPEAKAGYLIAELFVQRMAGFARKGVLPVPERYAELYKKSKLGRLPRFIEENNKAAGYTVCDHEYIYISDIRNLSLQEKYAILATHTANASFNSFAAELRLHACFLLPIARLSVPFSHRSLYASAVRADMSIAASELEGYAPFHNPKSRLLRQQTEIHGKY